MLLFLSLVFANNIVLVQLLALGPQFQRPMPWGIYLCLGLCTGAAVIAASVLSFFVNQIYPLGDLYLVVAMLLIACVVLLISTILTQLYPRNAQLQGVLLPLIMANAGVLAAVLQVQNQAETIGDVALISSAHALGFLLVLLLYAGCNKRIAMAKVPLPFQGLSIQLLTLGLLALAFAVFSQGGGVL